MLKFKPMFKPPINPVTPCKQLTLAKKEDQAKCCLLGLQCLLSQKRSLKKEIQVLVGNHKL